MAKPQYNKKKFLLTFCLVMGVLAIIRHTFISEDLDTDSFISENAEEDLDDEELAHTDSSFLIGSAELKVPNPSLDTDSFISENAEEDLEEDLDIVEEEELESTDSSLTDSSFLTPNSSLFNSSLITKKSYDYSPEEEREVMASLGLTSRDSIELYLPEKYRPLTHVHSYSACFPDIQPVQLRAAMRNGISPIHSRQEAQAYIDQQLLVNITNSPFYVVDRLTHSMPLLVPKCQELLNTICVNFIDSLIAHGIPPHVPIVTSVLRTASDISKLQRNNVNATTHSCHCYGTTVDITYNRFYPITGSHHTSRQNVARYNERMKKMLAEVLLDLRMQGRCYVKHERKQACFHLTVR